MTYVLAMAGRCCRRRVLPWCSCSCGRLVMFRMVCRADWKYFAVMCEVMWSQRLSPISFTISLSEVTRFHQLHATFAFRTFCQQSSLPISFTPKTAESAHGELYKSC